MSYKKIGSLCCGAFVLSLNLASAGEHTVELGALEQILKVEAVAMPDKHLPITLEPKVWKLYQIESVIAHGTAVKKGDVLVDFDAEKLSEKIDDLTNSLVKEKIFLEKAELKFADFKVTTKNKLTEAELKYSRFTEDYKHYKETSKPVRISNIEYSVTRAENSLAYSQEELEQLNKMYEEDGLTEETEEIIIQRVKNSLVAAKRSLDSAKRSEKREKEVQLVRADADWGTKAAKEKRELELIKKSLPLDLKVKELEMTKMREDLAESQKELEELKSDLELMSIVSPVDGIVYYGEFKDGRWSNEAAKKIIRVGGSVPAKAKFMSILPEDSSYTFNAYFTEQQKIQLGDKREGSIRLKTKNWSSIPATIGAVDDLPLLNQKWVVKFTPSQELTDKVLVGSKAEVSVMTLSVDDVLSIPMKAVKSHNDGTFSVELKMANKDPQETKIQIGREAGDKLEVLDGLENGQVIIISDSKSK